MQSNLLGLHVLSAALVVVGCTSIVDLGPAPNFSISAEDVIAIGKLDNLEAEAGQYRPDDLLGHGWFSANLHVSNVEAGKLTTKVIPVRYFGHTSLSEDKVFRLHLRLTEEGSYIICKTPGSSGYNCEEKGGS